MYNCNCVRPEMACEDASLCLVRVRLACRRRAIAVTTTWDMTMVPVVSLFPRPDCKGGGASASASAEPSPLTMLEAITRVLDCCVGGLRAPSSTCKLGAIRGSGEGTAKALLTGALGKGEHGSMPFFGQHVRLWNLDIGALRKGATRDWGASCKPCRPLVQLNPLAHWGVHAGAMHILLVQRALWELQSLPVGLLGHRRRHRLDGCRPLL